MPAATARSRPTPPRTIWRGSARCSPTPSGRSCCSAAAAGTPRRSPTSAPSPRPTSCRPAPPSAARISSTTRHRLYAGDVGIGVNPKLAERIRQSDLLIALGPRLGEMTTSGYTLIDIPVPQMPLVHIHAGAEELGRVYQPALAINSGMPQAAAALKALAAGGRESPARRGARRAQRLSRAHQAARQSRQGADGRDRRLSQRQAAGGRDHRQRRRQLRRLGQPLLPLPPLPHPARADQRRHGLRLSGGARGEIGRAATAPSSASPATAVS